MAKCHWKPTWKMSTLLPPSTAQLVAVEGNLQGRIIWRGIGMSIVRNVNLKQETLKTHINTIHEVKPLLKCDECDYMSQYSNLIKRHRGSVHEKKRWNCTQCEYTSSSNDITKRHMKVRHEGFVFTCQDCNFSSTSQSYLNIHSKVNHQGVQYQCNVCDLSFATKIGLDGHKLNKHEGVRFKCPQCDYKATLRCNLIVHTQAMHEGKSYRCTKCSYTGSTPRSLSLHNKSYHAWHKLRLSENTVPYASMYNVTGLINIELQSKVDKWKYLKSTQLLLKIKWNGKWPK